MKRKVIIATVAAAALIGGGAATAVATGGTDDAKPLPQSQSQVRLSDDDGPRDAQDDDGDDRDGRDDDSADKADRDESAGKSAVSLEQAQERILGAVPGTVTELELDTDDNRLTWEADVLAKNGTWHKVELDAGNGKVLRQSTDRDDDSAREKSEAGAATVDVAEAARAAADATNGSVTSVELERGRWDIDAVDKKGVEHEVSVDTKTGKVTHQQAEDQDDHDHDHDAQDDDHDADDQDD